MRARVADKALAAVGALPTVKLEQAAHLAALWAAAALDESASERLALASGYWAKAIAEVAACDVN